LNKNIIDLALTLAVIAAFIWVICAAVVFVIKATRSKKIFGAEFDPEKPHTERRSR
jgi:hypothetical protein